MRRSFVAYLTVAVALALVTVEASLSTATVKASTCRTGQLRLHPSFYGEAGGQFVQTFTATNTSGTPCSVAGWPNLSVKGPSSRVETAQSIRVVQSRPASNPFDTVVVRPGAAASFDVFGADWNAAANRSCPRTHALLIALPGARPLAVTVSLPYCGPFYVAPVIAGKTDRDSWSVVWAKRWCRMQQFTVSIGRRISEATGQHTLALRLTNRGAACTLYGRPALWFEDTHGRIPFQLRSGTDQMITATYALPVQVRQGGSAWVVINHYRCDLGDKRAASVIRMGVQDASYRNTIRVVINNPYQVDYCGKGDPGSTITVAPFEPTLLAAFRP
jgi:hypothetical protein